MNANNPVKKQVTLEVVGHCHVCGNPVYGPKGVPAGQSVSVKRTCDCLPLSKTFERTMRTT